VKKLVATAENAIDEAVQDGRLTQEHAAEIKSELEARIESFVNGDLEGHGHGFHPGFGPGGMSPRGPPAFEGPGA
jgi:hypothetical protein